MKKLFALVLCLLMVCAACVALADYSVGDTVTVTISVSNPNGACAFDIGFSYDRSALKCTGAEGVNGVAGGPNGFSFVDFSLNAFGGGNVGTATFEVLSNAVPGKTYTITAYNAGAYNANDDEVSMNVFTTGGSVTIASAGCTEHVWDAGVVTTAATCEQDGVKTFACTNPECTQTKTEVIPAIGHAYDEGVVTTAATCEQDGVKTFTCQNDASHTYTEAIDAIGHDYDEGVVTTEPTCKAEGVKTFTCQNDPKHTKTEAIPVTEDHKWDAGVEKPAPTCTAEGLLVTTCTVCGKTEEETIPAKGHSKPDQATVVPPTCTEDGSESYKCTVCGTEIDGEVIPATGHEYDAGVETTAATCEQDGVKTFTCQNEGCGHTYTEALPAIGHDYDEGVVTTAATCEQDGVKTFTCQNDASHTYTEAITAIGHAYDEGVVTTEPTCKAEGVKTFTCQNDPKHTKTEAVPVTEDHKWDAGVEKLAPTCTEEGTKVFTCTVCDKTKEENVPAKGHTKPDQATITPPTCTEDGTATYKCTVCGTAIEGEVIPATGHSYNAGVETKAPTCEEDGELLFTCQNEGCGHTYTEAIDAIGHQYDAGVETTAPTCETDGVKTFTCQNDASHTYTEAIKAIGHDYDDGVVTTPAACERDGVKTFTCQNDASHTYTEAIPATGHTGEWIVTRPPTTDEPGEKCRVCETCGKTEYAEIPNFILYRMTASSIGPRFRDVREDLDVWNMFTAIDLSVEGEQTFDLIAGNMHIIGEVTVLVENGYVTVTYKLNNEWRMTVETEFMTLLASLNDVETVDPELLTGFAFGEPISIADQLNGDTKVLLYINNSCYYYDNISGIGCFLDNSDYEALVEAQMAIMD